MSIPKYVRLFEEFGIADKAYRYMLDTAGAWDLLHAELDEVDPTDVTALARKAKRAREIVNAYGRLQDEYDEEVSLAVRSSATAEFLVRLGIEPISLNPDTVVKTTGQVLQLEQQLAHSS